QSSCSSLDLPSFPTRRSSDLMHDVDLLLKLRRAMPHHLGCARVICAPAEQRQDETGRRCDEKWPPFFQFVSPRHFGRTQIQFHRDRKSTRLNSSHVAISYAVF